MDLRDKSILVVGFGKTGQATCRFLLKQGARVTVTDRRKRLDIPDNISERQVRFETGRHTVETFLGHDLIVISPGVPMVLRGIIEAQAQGIEVISEIELAYRFLNAPLIALTGTNGKTTTTELIGHMFSQAGKTVFVGGNIGTPLIDYVTSGKHADYVIAEISSFQLEGIKHFRPRVSVLLNITEDHLDRYPSFDDYAATKAKIFLNQSRDDFAVLNHDDPRVQALGQQTEAETYYFSTAQSLKQGAYDDGACHILRPQQEAVDFSLAGAHLVGTHNTENMLAAAMVGSICNLPPKTIQESLLHFKGLPHRMEFVAEVNGIRFYNDSKGTNVGACLKSIESLHTPIVLIAGGKDKGGSYQPLRDAVTKSTKAVVLIGEARERIHSELEHVVPTLFADSLIKAVEAAYAQAAPGDAVLFSPACSSFDMFKNYEHRGECFKDLVKVLKQATGKR
ncbi:MAG: UDP-N-acetylmuramoyl-L-alanine--D-glutamate ligase [Deltaproteobacteria bacterium]|nr:UDP-N-acetylmuramoyl-L-alanine--D-glutamate ligase [Deltaproteobacteria bacterium]